MSNFLTNETFRRSEDLQFRWLSAVVGTNGFQNIKRYADGYAKATIILLEQLIKSRNTFDVDILVYPIVFCARHSLELYLKDAIMHLEKIRTGNLENLKQVKSNHDIGKIWKNFKESAVKTDRRYLPIIDKLEEYVADFAEIDSTGQTFRYSNDTDNNLHLQNTPLINLRIFAQRFETLSQILSDLDKLGRNLEEEYSLGTFTKNLSRYDLETIAKCLPDRDKWTSDEFSELKLSIRKEFHQLGTNKPLSSNELAKALNIIEKHRRFASEIGAELRLEYATTATFVTFLKHFDKLHSQDKNSAILIYSDFDSQEFLSEGHNLADCINLCKASMSANEIADVITVYTLGKESGSCEFYEQILQEQLAEIVGSNASDDSQINDYLGHYLNKVILREFIEKGLDILGQRKILSDIHQT